MPDDRSPIPNTCQIITRHTLSPPPARCLDTSSIYRLRGGISAKPTQDEGEGGGDHDDDPIEPRVISFLPPPGHPRLSARAPPRTRIARRITPGTRQFTARDTRDKIYTDYQTPFEPTTLASLPTTPRYSFAPIPQTHPHLPDTMQNPHPRSSNFDQEFGDRWVQQFNQDYQTWFYVDKNTGQSSWTQ